MLKRLRLKNFKSWKDTGHIDFAPVTAFFGANSSGKSSILQSLLLLKQTQESPDKDIPLYFGDDADRNSDKLNLGSFRDVITRSQADEKLSFELQWTAQKEIQIVNPEGKKSKPDLSSNEFTFRTEIKELASGKECVDSFSYSIGETSYGLKRNDKAEYSLSLENPPFKLVRFSGRVWNFPSPKNFYGFPKQTTSYYRNADFLADLELSLVDLLDNIKYLGPLRIKPARRYVWSGSKPSDVGVAGDRTIDALAYAKSEKLQLNHRPKAKKLPFDAFIADWLKRLGLMDSFKITDLNNRQYEVKMKRTLKSKEVSLLDVGVGVSQILPVLTLINFVPKGSIVLIEQPEIHLHPSVQSALADMFIEAAMHRGIQIIIESHSEHLLRRLQRRIADKTIPAKDVKIYFCETDKGSDGTGLSEITDLELDLFGNIKNWPEDFFGDELEDMIEMQKAIIKSDTKQ